MSASVSVVIPLYNKANTIERAIRSVVNQVFTDIEIIVVDDGSTDDGASLAENFPDKRIRVIRQNNLGPGNARNSGIAASSAKLIAFLDADDEWLPEFLSRSVALLAPSENEVAVISGYFEGQDRRSTEQKWRARGLRAGSVSLRPETSASFVVSLLAYMNPWAMVVRRSTILQYGGFYEHHCLYGEDNYLWLKMILNETVGITLEPLVWWHSENSGLSRNLRGPRPIEPFFVKPSEIFALCPLTMQPLLRSVLAIRAGKTASMLSFWGKWREGRHVLQQFSTWREIRYSWVLLGFIVSQPVGAAAAFAIRKVFRLAGGSSRRRVKVG